MNSPDRQLSALAPREQAMLDSAINALAQTAGLTAKVRQSARQTASTFPSDAAVDIVADGNTHRYQVDIKRIDRMSTLEQVKHHFDKKLTAGLLVVPRVSAELAEKLRELDIQFIDGSGNAFLRAPGLFVFIKGQKAAADQAPGHPSAALARTGTATSLRVIFALLNDPSVLNEPYRTLSQAAHVSLGAIGPIMTDLQNRGFISSTRGNRRLLERERLMLEWATTFPTKLRPKLLVKRFRSPSPDWWQSLDIRTFDAHWGGEIGADRLTAYLRPQRATLYMRPAHMQRNLTALVTKHKLRADDIGDVEVLEAFWDDHTVQAETDTVPALLIYADLMASMDPRNFEVAQLIYKQIIDAPSP